MRSGAGFEMKPFSKLIEFQKIWVPMGTGYRPERNFWVPMDTGYQPEFL